MPEQLVTEPLTATSSGGAISEPPLRRFARRFRRERGAVLALTFLVVLITVVALSPILPFQDPNAQELRASLALPSSEYWLGTDALGRDLLARLLAGGRITLLASLMATAIAVVLGVPAGMVAGYYPRRSFDILSSQIVDAIIAIPSILLALAIIGVLGRDITNAMIALGVILAPQLFRVTRSAVISVGNEVFIEASRSMSARDRWILLRHMVPNSLSAIIVRVTLTLAFATLAETGISFLGLGAQPPQDSWGSIVAKSTTDMENRPLLVLLPGLLIFATVLSLNTLGDGLRNALGRETMRR